MIGRYISPYLIWKCLAAILVFVFALTDDAAFGQASLKGRIRDTAFDKDCPMAVVSLLAPDSTLIKYTRSRKDGSFNLQGLVPGEYRLLVTHPSYTAYFQIVHIQSAVNIDLGVIPIPPRADTLAPVTVTPRVASPLLRGDTIEYNTAHIKLRINATVEELLHRLPGIRVDPDGNITINGQKIERLLVDGKEFFSGDPKVVTRNFNGDMIAKVQVLDKKSKQAEFTGVDDGQRTKTINLVLKEDSKRGTLMKAEAGGDPQGYYNAGALVGAFNGSMQFAALGMAANTGNSSFSSDVGGLQSGLNMGGGGGDAFGASAGTGIPRVMAGGIHYANDWKNNADHVVGNYQYGRLSTSPFSTLKTRQTLPDSIYVQQQQDNSENTRDQHNLFASYEFVPDTISTYGLYVGATNMQGHNLFNSAGSSSFNDTLVNTSQRMIRSDGQSQGFIGNLRWRMRAKKNRGRVLSATFSFNQQNNDTRGFLYSLNNYYKPDRSLLHADTTDQRKDIDVNNVIIDGSVNYTEPLKRGITLAVSYGINFNSSRSQQSTFDKGDGKYNEYVDSLSNHYRNNVLTQRATVNLQSHIDNVDFVVGGDLLQYGYTQSDVLKGTSIRYQYLNFAPRVSSHIVIKAKSGINFDYNGSTQQPSITQLQPVQNNNDPLHIMLGNPNLRGSFSHHFFAQYASYDAHNLFMALNVNLTTHNISTRTVTDSLGRQISQAMNVDGSYDAALRFSYKSNIKPVDVNIAFLSNFSYSRNVNYVNQYISRNDNYVAGGGIELNKYVSEKYNFGFRNNVSYTYSGSSINTTHPVHYWSQFCSGEMSFFPTPGLELGASVFYTWRQRLDNFDTRNSSVLWNMHVGKDLFKNQLNIKWEINDILGQNIGITRSSTANQTSESNINVLGRYWMLSATWRFVHHRKLN